eukprot:3937593-Rhodomonas_salina.1
MGVWHPWKEPEWRVHAVPCQAVLQHYPTSDNLVINFEGDSVPGYNPASVPPATSIKTGWHGCSSTVHWTGDTCCVPGCAAGVQLSGIWSGSDSELSSGDCISS